MASLYWFDPHHKGWHFSCSRSGLVEARAAAPAAQLGGDPPGPCARLHIPGQRGDSWGDGFAIY